MNKLKRFAYHLVSLIFFSVGSLFFLVGSLLIILFTIISIDNLLFLAKAESVQGSIIALVPKPNDSLERYFLKIAFREETTKRRFEFISSRSFSLTAYNEDEKIKVYYDPKNPEDAKIKVSEVLLGGVIIMLILIVFLFAIGFSLVKTGRKIMRQKEM